MTVKLVDGLSGLPVEPPVLFLKVADLPVELATLAVDLLALILGELLHILVAERLAVLDRHHRRSHDR